MALEKRIFTDAQKIVGDIKDLLFAAPKFLVVGICGPSGSGKTALCKSISTSLHPEQSAHLECDFFSQYGYQEREGRIKNARKFGDPLALEVEEHPKNWYHWADIENAVGILTKGGDLNYCRGWNKETGECDLSYKLSGPKAEPGIILVDCIYLLHDPINKFFDVTVFLDIPSLEINQRLQVRRPPCFRKDVVRAEPEIGGEILDLSETASELLERI